MWTRSVTSMLTALLTRHRTNASVNPATREPDADARVCTVRLMINDDNDSLSVLVKAAYYPEVAPG